MDGQDLLGRLPAALVVNLLLAGIAYRAGSVRGSGFLGGLLVGVPVYAALGWRGFLVLVGMFAVGTVLTRWGYARKSAMGVAEEKEGARGASHALANVGFAAIAALGAWALDSELLRVAFVSALATSSMDTAGSELGPLYGRTTLSTRTFRPVPPGTEGAMSLEGTLGGLAAGAVLGLIGVATGVIPAWALLAVLAGALVGNVYEAFAGSHHLMPHSWLNASNTLVGGAAAAALWVLIAG